MKDNTCQQLAFTSICGRRLTAVFDDHRVTSDGGVGVADVKRQIKVIDALADAIVDSHHASYLRQEIWEMIAQASFRSLWGMRTQIPRSAGRSHQRRHCVQDRRGAGEHGDAKRPGYDKPGEIQ